MSLKYIIIGTRLDILKSYKIIIVKVKRQIFGIKHNMSTGHRKQRDQGWSSIT